MTELAIAPDARNGKCSVLMLCFTLRR